MLETATAWLAARSSSTLVVARLATRFAARDAGMVPLDADWDTPSFQPQVRRALERLGTVERALLWLHEPEPTLRWLLRVLNGARTVLVVGSMDGLPTNQFETRVSCAVRLGSVATPSGRRWLTHDEISEAAIASLQDGRSRVVGDLRPIEAR